MGYYAKVLTIIFTYIRTHLHKHVRMEYCVCVCVCVYVCSMCVCVCPYILIHTVCTLLPQKSLTPFLVHLQRNPLAQCVYLHLLLLSEQEISWLTESAHFTSTTCRKHDHHNQSQAIIGLIIVFPYDRKSL